VEVAHKIFGEHRRKNAEIVASMLEDKTPPG
jgi:hypothetical protein